MSAQVYLPQTTFSQVTLPQSTLMLDALDFSFMDSQLLASDPFPTTSVPSVPEYSDTPNTELDEQFMNIVSNLTPEEIQQMVDSFSASLVGLQQETQPVPFDTSYIQSAQTYEPAIDNLPHPFMVIPSQSPVDSQCAAPAPEQLSPAPLASTKTPHETATLKAVTLLKLNMRFNSLFQNAGIVSCPDKIDLNAGIKREDAMVAAGYLPQTHIPWEQALKFLGKQGFRIYYYNEVKKARIDNTELPPIPEWITRYCFAKGAGKRPTGFSREQPTESSLKNQQVVAKVMLARNNPTKRSKAAAAASRKNMDKGKAVDTLRYSPYTRR
ncbi:unnamed protein product [Rhizoctonia solani]|uniref:Uncharacterized protein n=1 Tax=Rhizoctonia solani TaxID=456999 RepID=A0A8H3BRA5_9AGAM|nr:unnamed protein product [Rhizoctonia solani]